MHNHIVTCKHKGIYYFKYVPINILFSKGFILKNVGKHFKNTSNMSQKHIMQNCRMEYHVYAVHIHTLFRIRCSCACSQFQLTNAKLTMDIFRRRFDLMNFHNKSTKDTDEFSAVSIAKTSRKSYVTFFQRKGRKYRETRR